MMNQLCLLLPLAEYDLTVGPDWILPSTDFTSSKKSVFIHARGPFGDALLARSALASAHDALLLRSDFTMRQPRTETLLLLVELRGGLPERLLDLSRGIVLSRNLNRRLVLVWESHEVGGIELQEILEAQYLVLTPANLATGLPPTNLPIVFVSVHDLAARQNGSEHVRVGDVDKIGSGLIDEVVFNTAVGLLRPVFPLKEATFRLLVGRNFRGLVVDRGNACGESALFAGLKVCLRSLVVRLYYAIPACHEASLLWSCNQPAFFRRSRNVSLSSLRRSNLENLCLMFVEVYLADWDGPGRSAFIIPSRLFPRQAP